MLSSLDTSHAALARRYEEIPYDALPHRASHPARLASVAALAGHAAPDVEHCSVLEVGCSDGSNLIPMAVALPGARFVGCDLSAPGIEEGLRTIAALGLTNITLVEGDLAALGREHGGFDYIVAHGVYSWVPAHVRDALLALAEERLAPAGILYVSFNVLPGCRVRQAVWDVLHQHVDAIEDPRARLHAAREVARLVGEASPATLESDQAVRAEFRAVAQRSDSELYHDDLAVPNEPVLFHAFADHAARHGLRYLADADFPTLSLAGDASQPPASLSTLDPIAREQYLDFVRLRRFRQALLVRVDAPSAPAAEPKRLRQLHVSASWELARGPLAGAVHKLARRLDPASGGGGAMRKLLDALVASHPATLPIASLDRHVDVGALAARLDAILREAYEAGIVELWVRPPPITIAAADRPLASPLARLQAGTRDRVTTLLHMAVSIADRSALQLLPLVDGTRDRAALVAAVRALGIQKDPSQATGFVDFALEKFARLGLLMTTTADHETGTRAVES
ncbi:MAG TPA: class I SAM-dependent methyltransferase [Caldimonas sp.]|jgi:protein-L-isoaspartate O-methyltransferase|nr:class I SAM-dependent methyltransferase [Caldimonas sp.]HEX2542723.1 class I SAM-dependent methyltransferase [Caldimonas sp.]